MIYMNIPLDRIKGFGYNTYAIIIEINEWPTIKAFETQNIEISNSNIVTPEKN